jgi:NAD(P)-dependent dehydrogenase (short-subunit alcohol dehydrogenase family)
MTRVFITGSADGLGRLAAETLLDDGHEVVVHVRVR